MTQREIDIKFVGGLSTFLGQSITWRQWRKLPRKTKQSRFADRVAARLMHTIFSRRVRRNQHQPLTPWQVRVVRRFTFGRYCGVGHGVPQGETRRALGPVDQLCQVHDTETAESRSLS
jgi:hypothetical protein